MGIYDILDELDFDGGVEVISEPVEPKGRHGLTRAAGGNYDPLGRFQTPVPSWMLKGDAPCVDMAREEGLQETLEIFYGANTWHEAKRVCAPCPYKGECREYADTYGEEGVWGESTFPQRISESNNQGE